MMIADDDSGRDDERRLTRFEWAVFGGEVRSSLELKKKGATSDCVGSVAS